MSVQPTKRKRKAPRGAPSLAEKFLFVLGWGWCWLAAFALKTAFVGSLRAWGVTETFAYYDSLFMDWIAFGVALALFQYLLIRIALRVSFHWWIPATVAGWVLAWMAWVWMDYAAYFPPYLLIWVILPVLQWLAIRERSMNANGWLKVNTIIGFVFVGSVFVDITLRNNLLWEESILFTLIMFFIAAPLAILTRAWLILRMCEGMREPTKVKKIAYQPASTEVTQDPVVG